MVGFFSTLPLVPFCSWNKNPAFTYAWAFWALGIIWKCENCVMKNINHQHTHCNAVSNSIMQILSLLGRIRVKIMDTCLMCMVYVNTGVKIKRMCILHIQVVAYILWSAQRNGFSILKNGKYKKMHGTQIAFIHSHNFMISQIKCSQTRLHNVQSYS